MRSLQATDRTRLLAAVALVLLGSGSAAAGRGAAGPWTTPAIASPLDAGDGLRIVGQLGGSASAVALEDGRLYVGLGPRVVVFDVSGEGEPVRLGQSPILPSVVYDLVVADGIAYAASQAGLSVVDARMPQAPRVVAFLPTNEGTLRDGWSIFDPLLAHSGQLIYFAPHPYEPVRVLDVSAPERPIEVATLHVAEPVRALSSIAVEGTTAYLAYAGDAHASKEGVIVAFDLSTPRAPQRLGSIGFGTASLGGLAVAGRTLLMSRGGCSLEAIDVSDPARLRAVGCLDWDWGSPNPRIEIDGALAFVVDDRDSTLWIVDWSNPHAMELVGQLSVAAADVAVDARRGRWFVGAPAAGLLTYAAGGLLDTAERSEVAIDAIGWGGQLAIVGDAVVLGVAGATRVYDIAGSGALEPVADIAVELTGRSLALDDAIVLLPHGSAVHAYDLSRRSTPQPLGVYTATGTIHSMTAAGDRVVLTGDASRSDGYIEVVDYSTPAVPRRIGHQFTWAGTYRAAAVEGDRLFLSRLGRLDVWRIDPLGQPEWIAQAGPLSEGFEHLVARGGYLYAARDERLTIFDARTADAVRVVYTAAFLADHYLRPSALSLIGDTLVMPWRTGGFGVWLFDMSDPSRPRPAGLFGAGGAIVSLIVAGERVAYLWNDDSRASSKPLRLRSLRVERPMDVRLASMHAPVGHAQSVALYGDLALVTGWPDDLSIVDVADPVAPRLLSTLRLPQGADRVAAADGFAYVSTPPSWERQEPVPGTVHIVDLSDPRQPRRVSSVPRSGAVFDLSASDGRLYLAESSGLAIFDVRTEPGQPLELGGLPSRAQAQQRVGSVTHVVATDRHAVVVDAVSMDWNDPRDDGEADALRVVDATDPSRLVELGAVSLGGSSWSGVRGIDLDWPYVYAVVSQADESMNARVYVIDVSLPSGPKVETDWLMTHQRYPTALSVAGPRVYVGAWFGIEVLDRTTATDLRPAAHAITPGTSYGAADLAADASGRVVFANANAGLLVLKDEAVKPPEPRPARVYLPRVAGQGVWPRRRG